ncbi:MAG: porin [Rhizobiaceae bacterium]
MALICPDYRGFAIAIVATLCGHASYAQDEGEIFRYYGQFHFAYQAFDDGVSKTENLVDITNANSRIGFHLDGGAPIAFHFETGLGFRPSSDTSQTNTPEFLTWNKTFLRIVELTWDTGYGTFGFGQGKMPTDGAAEVDLGKTVVVAKSTIPEANGSYIFRNKNGVLSDITVKDGFDNLDGSRRFRVRYDSPEIAGFSFAAAYGREVLKTGDDNRYYDVVVNHGAQLGAFEIAGKLGVAFTEDRQASITTSETVGSFALMHSQSGLNISIAGGKRNNEGGRYVYLKPGWNTDLFPIGTTKFVAELFSGNGYETNGSTSQMWGAGIIQEFSEHGLEIYAGYRGFSYSDRTATRYQDANVIQIGARARF